METKLWHITNNEEENNKAIKAAANLLIIGEVVAFPTETVYGLGADATNEVAVAKIFKAKGRPGDNPLIAHVASKEQLSRLVQYIPTYVDTLIDHFSPGPITYVLPSNGKCAANVTAGLDTVAIRIPDHPVANRLLTICDVPIAAPSANTSGKPSPTQAKHVADDLVGRIAGILDGGATGIGMESTVIDCTGDIPMILRPGGITKEQLEEVIGEVAIDPAIFKQASEQPKSPGMKYKHYAPDVPLWLVKGDARKLQSVVDEERQAGKKVAVLASNEAMSQLEADQVVALGNSLAEIAANLYASLRTFKQTDVDLIICEMFPLVGIGEAIMNRLEKAAVRIIEG